MTVNDAPYAEAFAGRRVLVTGGAGFIGSHLVERLIDLGADVTVLDDLSTGHATNLPVRPGRFIKASILNDQALRYAMAGCEIVFHEAALVSVAESVDDPMRCLAINTTGTERLLEAAGDLGVKRVIFAASAAAYGEAADLPCRENQPADCRSPYAASKVAAESLLAAFGRCYDLSTVSLRYFNIFGPRQDPKSPYAAAIAAFTDAFAAGRQPTVFGTGEQTRDFTYIDNVVHANLLAAAAEHPLAGEVINIGTGTQISLLQVIDALAERYAMTATPQFADPRPGDVIHSVADITKARDLLGYAPLVDFHTGLARTIDAPSQTPAGDGPSSILTRASSIHSQPCDQNIHRRDR